MANTAKDIRGIYKVRVDDWNSYTLRIGSEEDRFVIQLEFESRDSGSCTTTIGGRYSIENDTLHLHGERVNTFYDDLPAHGGPYEETSVYEGDPIELAIIGKGPNVVLRVREATVFQNLPKGTEFKPGPTP